VVVRRLKRSCQMRAWRDGTHAPALARRRVCCLCCLKTSTSSSSGANRLPGAARVGVLRLPLPCLRRRNILHTSPTGSRPAHGKRQSWSPPSRLSSSRRLLVSPQSSPQQRRRGVKSGRADTTRGWSGRRLLYALRSEDAPPGLPLHAERRVPLSSAAQPVRDAVGDANPESRSAACRRTARRR
jgi:hypothetical protein